MSYGRRETNLSPFNFMRSQTVILVRWKLTDRIEVFINLGKLYSYYDNNQIGVSRWTLDRKNLFDGYENDIVSISKIYVK